MLALGLAGWGMAGTFGGPFARGWLGHNGARYAQIGRNHDRLGLLHLRAAPLLDPEPAPASGPGDGAAVPDGAPGGETDPGTVAGVHRPDVYAHHPPGLGLTLGVVFRLFGVGEDAARAVPAVATILSLLLLAVLVAGVAGAWAGALAALIAATMPMVSVYGAHVDVQGPPVLLFSLLTLWAYRRWLDGGGVLPLLAAAALASAFDWYGLYAPAGCALHLWSTRPSRRRATVGLAAWTALLFLGWLTWLLTLPGMSRELLGEAAGVRGWGTLLSMREQLGPGFGAWLAGFRELMPLAGWILAVAILLGLPRRGAGAGAPALGPVGLCVLLLGPPLVHAALFPTGMLQHGYWLFALPYGVGAFAAVALTARIDAAAVWRRGLRAAGLALVAWALLRAPAAAGRVLAEDRVDAIPVLVGRGIHEQTAPGEVVLTSYDCNPLEPARAAGYVLKHPAVTFYADRTVRGDVRSPEALAEALDRVPGAHWFLLTPPAGAWVGGTPDPALAAALAARSAGEPRVLSGDPPVTLHRLAR